MKQHMHAFFWMMETTAVAGVCDAVTEALETYQSPRLLHSSKGHFLHCPQRLGKSAKALPAEGKRLSYNDKLFYRHALQPA